MWRPISSTFEFPSEPGPPPRRPVWPRRVAGMAYASVPFEPADPPPPPPPTGPTTGFPGGVTVIRGGGVVIVPQ